jgi:hypothetical protein
VSAMRLDGCVVCLVTPLFTSERRLRSSIAMFLLLCLVVRGPNEAESFMNYLYELLVA